MQSERPKYEDIELAGRELKINIGGALNKVMSHRTSFRRPPEFDELDQVEAVPLYALIVCMHIICCAKMKGSLYVGCRASFVADGKCSISRFWRSYFHLGFGLGVGRNSRLGSRSQEAFELLPRVFQGMVNCGMT